jgi:NAD(P)-dependent dehydrogenase (short-subunit alcohol dehydrogenase family)
VPQDPADLSGRVCLVTGATSGHGRAVAFGLARLGAELVILGRDPGRCRSVQAEIAEACGGRAPALLLCDLASRREVERAAAELLASGRPLHVLVNNAGLVSLARRESPDGVELTMAVNYLAAFQLTLLLLPRLRASAPARIVNVSSDTHRIARLDPEDLALRRVRHGWLRAYARSKLALVHFTLELARRLEGSGVTANALDPGPVASNIGSGNPGLAYRLAAPLIGLFPSPERAARLAIELCASPALARRSGEYWRFGRPRRPSLRGDARLSARLWRRSEELTGARFEGRVAGA